MIRKIVQIDREKCDGCGLCVPSCAEGAIRIVGGKAEISAENLCDGLGACLGECPQDAISIIEREADSFDEEAVHRHLETKEPAATVSVKPVHGGCPGSRVASFSPKAPTATETPGAQPSRLGQWPVQLHLVPPQAPYLKGADLLITADCVPFAYADYHRDFLAGKAVLVGCPKLDDLARYAEKLTEIFAVAAPKSITVLRMEVPCCTGIVRAAQEALAACGREIPFTEVTIGIRGEVLGKR